ncbi:hypothetical protein K438DRAFT_1973721 [Mycena galopus ATCC 62051]|nr:hypothetical protein K438DRAFT_1973721 [Mycena galopus ATCC 62051]
MDLDGIQEPAPPYLREDPFPTPKGPPPAYKHPPSYEDVVVQGTSNSLVDQLENVVTAGMGPMIDTSLTHDNTVISLLVDEQPDAGTLGRLRKAYAQPTFMFFESFYINVLPSTATTRRTDTQILPPEPERPFLLDAEFIFQRPPALQIPNPNSYQLSSPPHASAKSGATATRSIAASHRTLVGRVEPSRTYHAASTPRYPRLLHVPQYILPDGGITRSCSRTHPSSPPPRSLRSTTLPSPLTSARTANSTRTPCAAPVSSANHPAAAAGSPSPKPPTPPCASPSSTSARMANLDAYPMHRPSLLCKVSGGGRWEPKPGAADPALRVPVVGGKPPYELEMEHEMECEKAEEKRRCGFRLTS